MYKLKLTFGAFLRKARGLKRFGWSKEKRFFYLSGLINGAENWELPE